MSRLHSTISTPMPSAPQVSGQKPSGASATVSNPAIHSSELQLTGSPSILSTSLSSAQSLSVSGPLSSPHGTVHRTKSTKHGTPVSPSLSGQLTPATPSSPTGSVTTSTTAHSPKSPAPTAISTSLSVGVVGLLPGELSGGPSLSVLPDPVETTNIAHSKPAATGNILNTGKPSVSLPTGLSTTDPFPGESTSHLSSSAQTQKMPPSSNGDNFPTGTATTISGSAQKEPSSVISSRLPISNKHTATSVSDPVIVIVTPGQSTSWTNTWLRVSDSTSTSSQSSSATATTSSHDTLRPSGTIAIPEIPTGPSRDPETSNLEPTAPHTHSRLSKGTDTVTTIHAISTVTKVVTVPASDEPEAPAPTETKNPQTTQESKATATPNQTEKASDIPNPPPPSRKTKPTAETGVPATEPSITSVAQPTGAIDDALLRGLQVVPVTPQGFVTVTETKTETTTKTETETETETKTVYINPTFTMTADS
ncbi:uncharacterized protein LDX57_000564 [Aspergillus melleus]|uniref:uncharacterized protein n=1 Tax=Aspergillus melleus TaxID=138277 RepID=UPI001E8ED285|nr:uncharacterized protein LDX57_000564 [Aspergillus melleus]KAH8422809.1 hypothetical protein LDX57_000564 [Aspergillus melleus]